MKLSDKIKAIFAIIALVIIFSIIFYIAPLPIPATISIMIFSLLMGGIVALLHMKQDKDTKDLKVGDIVYISGCGSEAEVIETDGHILTVKTKVSRMRVTKQK